MTAATQKSGGQTARHRLQQCIGARVVPARRDVDVMLTQEVRQRLRRERSDRADALETLPRVSRKGQVEVGEVEVLVEPRQDLRAFPRIVRPARRDYAQTTSLDRA